MLVARVQQTSGTIIRFNPYTSKLVDLLDALRRDERHSLPSSVVFVD
jgi:hypothetical protein